MSTSPVETLIARADGQRDSLHRTASELKEKLELAQDKISVTKNVRAHFVGAFAVLSLIGFAVGYGLTGLFTRH